MKKIKIVCLVLLLFNLFSTVCHAESSVGWYIIKRGNKTPDFPADAGFIDDHNGFYVDKKCDENNQKKLYLTFDAGYENGNIEKILDILKTENVHAAFFILNNLIIKNTELVKRMGDDGHLVCNHTSNHKDMTTLSEDEMIANLKRVEDKYREYTGRNMEKIFRFPEGKYNKETVMTCYKSGYKTVFWSMAYDDWDNENQPTADVAVKKMLANTHNGAIILLHPTSETNVKILPILIKEWRAMGYDFGSLYDL